MFLIALLATGGCASYTPHPLAIGLEAVLAPPVAAIVARDALAIDRPYLKPVEIDLSQPLDPNAIAVVAVIANPDLKAQRLRAGVTDAQAFSARLLPDPTFSTGASKVVNGPDPLLDLANALAIDLNALRTHAVRRAQADAQTRQVRLDLAWAEWQTAGQARIQAVRIQNLERALAIATAGRAATQSLLDRTLRAAGRGDLPADQVQAARIGAFDAQDRLRTLERDLAAARFELTKLLGLPPSFPLTLAPAPLPPPPPDADALFALARTARADLQALRAGYDAQEAATHKAVLDQFPTLGLSVNANRDSAGNTLLGPAIDFTLPLWNRNRGGIAIENATRNALKAEYDGRLFQTRAEIAAAVGGIAVAQRQRAAVMRDLPALDRFAAASRRAANRGDLALATAEAAEQAVRDKRALLAQAEQDLSEQSIALELLTGTPMEDWPR
ncbi:TolC family protein [Sphingomonas antarctica]|uniref:TolC family protein n=1 Tax=Sphingomonas antarctica TaxID=2040274 RepID=UPI0039EA4F5E